MSVGQVTEFADAGEQQPDTESGAGKIRQNVDESQDEAGSSRGRDAHAVGNVPDGGCLSTAYTVFVPTHPGPSHRTGKMR